MGKIAFIIVYWVVGYFAAQGRFLLNESSEIIYYMCYVNKIAGFVTMLTILYNVFRYMWIKIKVEGKSLKRIRGFLVFSLICIIAYWWLIYRLYIKYPAELMNDLVTICTLTVALTTDFYESFLKAMFYKG